MTNKKNKPHITVKKQNPALKQAAIKAKLETTLKNSFKDGIEYATTMVNIMTVMILFDKFNFSEEDLHKFTDEMDSISDSMIDGYVSIEDMIATIREEAHTNMTTDLLLKLYPGLNAYIPPEIE